MCSQPKQRYNYKMHPDPLCDALRRSQRAEPKFIFMKLKCELNTILSSKMDFRWQKEIYPLLICT